MTRVNNGFDPIDRSGLGRFVSPTLSLDPIPAAGIKTFLECFKLYQNHRIFGLHRQGDQSVLQNRLNLHRYFACDE